MLKWKKGDIVTYRDKIGTVILYRKTQQKDGSFLGDGRTTVAFVIPDGENVRTKIVHVGEDDVVSPMHVLAGELVKMKDENERLRKDLATATRPMVKA